MNLLKRLLGDGLFLLVLIVLTGLAVWVLLRERDKPAAPKPVAPAAVANPVPETGLTTVTLTPEAVQRLGIRTAPVERKAVARVRTLGGEVIVPPGRAYTVAAPLAGTLKAPDGGTPRPGQRVRKGQPVFLFSPILTPEARASLATSRVDAEGQVKNAQTQVDAATIALTRAQRLLSQEAGSRRTVDEAQAQHDLARKTLEAATARQDLLVRVVGDIEAGTAAPVVLEAPEAGLLRATPAAPGETVPSGAPLFEVAALDPVWVRVPVYVGDQAEIAADRPAAVGGLADRPGAPTREAKAVTAPPSANALAATVDLYYELANADAALAPAQRVGVTVPFKGEADSLVVPWSAVVHDVQGGTWVYEATGPNTYVRRRAPVRFVSGPLAVLASGPPPGTPVVVEAVAELFGTEFGIGK